MDLAWNGYTWLSVFFPSGCSEWPVAATSGIVWSGYGDCAYSYDSQYYNDASCWACHSGLTPGTFETQTGIQVTNIFMWPVAAFSGVGD